MRHATRAHDAGLGARADSIADVIRAACEEEGALLKARGVAADPCPARPW